MICRKFTKVLIAIFTAFGLSAQTTDAFRIDYDLALFDLPINSTEALTSGNYVFSGFHTNFLPIVSSLTEVNSTGTVVWSKQYSGGISYMFGDFKKDATLNRYYACGGSSSGPAFLLFLDASGNAISGKNFSISQADGAFFNRVIKTSDNGYLCVGYVSGYDPDGAGAETDFVPVTNNDVSCNSSTTQEIESPLIVKFDASGNHLWHHVFRYYVTSATAANRIYNDASFVDAVEVSDGYIAIGNYDVNNVFSTFDTDDCDDTTPNDAMFLKTTTAGVITYHRQIDNPSNSTSQSSKNLVSATITAAGLPLISGNDGDTRPALFMRLPGSGGWANPTWIRKYGGGSFFGAYYPLIPGRFFETDDGNYATWLSYVPISLPTTFSSVLMKINSSTSSSIFAKQYTFDNNVLATLFPHGEQVSDNGYIGVSYMFSASGHNMHFIKADPNGDSPSACPDADLSVTNETPSYTYGTPIYNSWNANTVTNVAITTTVTNITPVTSVICSSVGCTPPTAPTAAVASQPDCSTPTGSVTLTGLPTSGTWTITGTPSGTATGNTSSTTISGLAPGNYTFTVSLSGCTSDASNAVTINAVSGAPSAPTVGTITQTTCAVSTGSVALSGLPSSGTWTVTANPGGQTITGSGTTGTFTGLAAGTYTFTVSTSGGGGGTVTVYSEDFDGNSGAGSTWAVTNSTIGSQGNSPNIFYISDQESGEAAGNCGVSGTGDNSLHIGSTTLGDLGAAYDAGGLCPFFWCTNTDRRSFSNNINTTGLSNLTLSFNYIENGEGTDDNALLEYSINGGTSWLTLIDLAKTTLGACSPQGTWTAYSTTLPVTCENISNLRIAFRWKNDDDGNGTDPSFAVDDISITAPGASSSCTSSPSASAIINIQPTTPTAPVIGTITQPTCSVATGDVELTGLPASGTWTITGSPSGSASGSGTTTVLSGLNPGTYTFTVDNGTCSSAASLDAVINAAPTSPSAPVLGTVTQPTCSTPTGSVDLSGLPGTGTWTVTSSNGSTITGTGATASFGGLAPGTYTFTVTNAAGCTSAASSTNATINTVPGSPTAPVIGTITQPTCATSTGSVILNGLPSSGTWTVTASPGGATITGSGTSATFSGLAPGDYSFTVSTGSGGTSSIFTEDFEGGASGWTLNVTMGTEGADPNFFVVNDNEGGVAPTGCGVANNGDQTMHITSVFNPSGGAAYDAGGLCGFLFCPQTNRQSETPIINATGYSNLTLTFDYIARGQVGQDFASVWYNDGSGWQQLGAALQSPLCMSGQGQWTAYSAILPASCENNANLKLALRWQNNDDGVGTDPSFAINNMILSGLGGGCSSAPSASLTVLPPPAGPSITLTAQTDETCFGDNDGSATVNVTTGSGPYTYSWLPTGGSNSSASNLASGTYTVTVTDVNSCTSTLSVIISGPSAILANATVLDVDCAGAQLGAISTTASGGEGTYTYSWTPSGETTSSLNGIGAGTYTLTITDGNNCTASSTMTVGTTGSLNVVATPAYTEINSGDSVALTVSGGNTYTWIPNSSLSCSNCSNPIASPITSTEYIVTGNDANGCVGQDTVFVKVNIICGEFYIPSVFSPNQSGPLENEQLCVFGKEQCVAELDFTVYNRWGEIVFQTNDIDNCWDGTHRDKPVNSGVFVYTLYVKLSDGSIIELSGNTTLVR